MRYQYEPFILRRFANGRIFQVNPNIPFEYFFDCFQYEQPFFLLSYLEDGRIAIAPNAMTMPLSFFQTDYWPKGMLPTGYEYVTLKNESYPVILTAHPVSDFNAWLRTFEGWVKQFATQTLWDFVSSSYEFKPVREVARYETREATETAR